MIKTIIMFKKRDDISHEVFTDYWANQHTSIIRDLPGIRRFVQNHIDRDLTRVTPQFDGISESWFDSPEDLPKVVASEAYQRMIADEETFIDRSSVHTYIVRELEPFK